MKLSKYPNVVQNEIFDNLKTWDLILLSFVSKNMKKLIKLSQTKRLKSIVPNQEVKRIVYDYGPSHEGLVYIPIESHFRHKSRWWRTETEEVSILKMVEWNVAEKRIDFESGNCPVVSFRSMNKESAIESIHNCLFNFFGDSFEYHCPESKFYQTESIVLYLNEETLLAVLQRFQGRRAFLKCSDLFEIKGLIEFINRWKSGETFRKLEYLRISLRFVPRFPKTEILDAIGVKQIDETKTPPSHTVPRICGWRYFRPKTYSIISHTYVVRETDNRVASISIERMTLIFGVWNETEEEFLAMVK